MAFMRSQLLLVLLLAVICAITAKEFSVLEWKEFLKETQEYKNWCNNRPRCFLPNGRVRRNDLECEKLFFGLKIVMDEHNFDHDVEQNTLGILLNNTATLCSNFAVTPSTTSTAASVTTTSVPNKTGTHPSTFNTTDSGTSQSAATNVSTCQTVTKTEALETSVCIPLYLILPVLALVLIAVVVEGIHFHRNNLISGFHRLSKSNEEDAIDLESHYI